MIDLTVTDFLRADGHALVARLALADMQRFRRSEPAQVRAWTASLAVLRVALRDWDAAADWQLVLEFPLRRLGRRIDAVLVTPRAVVVLEFKAGADRFVNNDRRQVEDYALDLRDFHAASRDHPIVPVLVATEATPAATTWPLLLAGVPPVLDASAASLPSLLRDLWGRLPPVAPLDIAGWTAAPYRPVPGIVEAARSLYARHDVADLATARADAGGLDATTEAILAATRAAARDGRRVILFVTGIPGAGKTLCGLNAVFGTGREAGAAFLTGNPTLVHVLREALARDAAASGRQIGAARRETRAAIQALPAFRDHYVARPDIPAEHVIVIDEAQRSWSRTHAVRATRSRDVHLSDSEPGHILDIMARHRDWAAIVCLIGGGQEIHDGEGGLAEWGTALAERTLWRVITAPGLDTSADPRQRMPRLPGARQNPALHLAVAMRSLRNPDAAAWVDAVLAGDAATAARLAAARPVPFRVTRDLGTLRCALRTEARGLRRAGLVASAGAKRLRADGLGAELPHMDASAVANWFLDRWPDVRAADALEVVATQFACQGLELDHVGLCWGGDLIRDPSGRNWRVRDFAGTRWQHPAGTEAIANRINTYRVLLTRARYDTVIWVPRGDAADATRDPREMDAVAAFLLRCGAAPLATAAPAPAAALVPLLL